MLDFDGLAEAFLAQYPDEEQECLTLEDLASYASDHVELCRPIVFMGFARYVASEYCYAWFNAA